MVGIPSGRFSSLPGLGIHTLLNGFALSFPLISSVRFSLCSGDIAITPSTPAVFFP
jgi:hypothetical protein